MVLQLSKKHDSFTRNSPIPLSSAILSIYPFKRVNFLFENGIIESKKVNNMAATMVDKNIRSKRKQNFNDPGLINKSNDYLASHVRMRGPLLRDIYAPIIDFDWAVYVEDNHNRNRSLLGG